MPQLQVRGDRVGQLCRLFHAHGGDHGLVVQRLLQLHVLLEQPGDALHHLLDGLGHFDLLLPTRTVATKKPSRVDDFRGFGALNAFDQHLDVAVRHLHALHDVADRAGLVISFGLGFVHGRHRAGWREISCGRRSALLPARARWIRGPRRTGVIMYGKMTMSRIGIIGNLRSSFFSREVVIGILCIIRCAKRAFVGRQPRRHNSCWDCISRLRDGRMEARMKGTRGMTGAEKSPFVENPAKNSRADG